MCLLQVYRGTYRGNAVAVKVMHDSLNDTVDKYATLPSMGGRSFDLLHALLLAWLFLYENRAEFYAMHSSSVRLFRYCVSNRVYVRVIVFLTASAVTLFHSVAVVYCVVLNWTGEGFTWRCLLTKRR